MFHWENKIKKKETNAGTIYSTGTAKESEGYLHNFTYILELIALMKAFQDVLCEKVIWSVPEMGVPLVLIHVNRMLKVKKKKKTF